MEISNLRISENLAVPLIKVHTLVIGSGAAGLNAAVRLHSAGAKDVLILSEGLDKGTSINTGSDKQTYYKLNLCGSSNDSPHLMAEALFNGGSMHGDLALVEASMSPQAFMHLVNMGVRFPQDRYGQFAGYKTDHDPFQRATSVGPYTSMEMCKALINEVKDRNIRINENRVAVSILTTGEGDEKRAIGAITARTDINPEAPLEAIFEAYMAENIVFAVGGPGGLYKTSVYPGVHTGAIGLALMAGAKAQNLQESQFGMASIKFRWNVSGTYMQVIPRFINSKGEEFLRPYFESAGKMNEAIFLKGYQWPFDSRKAAGGSSIIDIIVYIETVINGERVFLDFTRNCDAFNINEIGDLAFTYLKNSRAVSGTPLERLRTMNPKAIELYKNNGLDITKEPLEIAVCSQHNNGGLSGNIWWESDNLKHFFPIGEVNGSHGVYRPGGAALNSGQVAAFRCAEYIGNRYMSFDVDGNVFATRASSTLKAILSWLKGSEQTVSKEWQFCRDEFQTRMSESGAFIRDSSKLKDAVGSAWAQYRLMKEKCPGWKTPSDAVEAMRNLQLCYAHAVYLDAIKYSVDCGVGSRGSALTLNKAKGLPLHPALDASWNYEAENVSFREKVMESLPNESGSPVHRWIERRPIPSNDTWFENVWAEYNSGMIYQ